MTVKKKKERNEVIERTISAGDVNGDDVFVGINNQLKRDRLAGPGKVSSFCIETVRKKTIKVSLLTV
jgi:hypothetical protein